MSLNIKNEETHRLARELAELTGETLTDAVTVALRERIARERNTEERIRQRSDALLAMGAEIARRIPPEQRGRDWDAYLYDEKTGLPR